MQVITGLMDGMRLKSVTLKKLHKAIIIKKPKKMPILKNMLFLNPYRPAFDMDIMLFGPGVKLVTST
jgi:hypothetical protein